MTTNVNQYPNGTSTAEPLNYPIYSLSLHFKLSFALSLALFAFARDRRISRSFFVLLLLFLLVSFEY